MMLRLTRPDRPERCTASLKGREAVQPWRHKLHEVVFEADTAPGRWFDTLLITCILISVAIAMLDSVAAISRIWGRWFYWTIVTMTTVGYGDIAPQTALGQVLASFIMIIGYGIIAVPTGIVTVELAQTVQRRISTQVCPACSAEGHDHDARHCKYCGNRL